LYCIGSSYPRTGRCRKLFLRQLTQADSRRNVESIDASPIRVVSQLAAQIEIQRPVVGPALAVYSPVSTQYDDFGLFDGTVDYSGTSGNSHIISTSQTETKTISPLTVEDRNMFTGDGTISLPIVTNAISSFSGGGNLLTESTLSASATITVTYTYVAPDLSLSLSSPSYVTIGNTESFSLVVSNAGGGSTSGKTNVYTTMPTGVSFRGAIGPDFRCGAANRIVNCVSDTQIPAGGSLPLTMKLGISADALPSINLFFQVATAGEKNRDNNTQSTGTVDVTRANNSGGNTGGGGYGGGNGDGDGNSNAGDGDSGDGDGDGDVSGDDDGDDFQFTEAVAGYGGPIEQDDPVHDAEDCPISEQYLDSQKVADLPSCFEFMPNREILFSDISNDPNKNYIEALRKTMIQEFGDYIISGSGNHSSGKQQEKFKMGTFPFEPWRGSSRLEVVKLAMLTNCIPIEDELPEATLRFKDIPYVRNENDDLSDFTARVFYTAASNGIVEGYKDGRADPFKEANNAEILAMLLRASNALPTGYGVRTPLHWYDAYVDFSKANNLISRDFNPSGSMNRSELSVLLLRIMALNPNPSVYSYMDQLNISEQEFQPLQTIFPPVAFVGSLTPNEETGCEDRAPNVRSCLGYDSTRDDTTGSHWASPFISFLKRTYHAVTGQYVLDDDGFSPEGTATRFDAVQMALKANCIPIPSAAEVIEHSFNDLPFDPTDVRSRTFSTAYQYGIIKSDDANPEDLITKVEAIAIALRSSDAIPSDYQSVPISYSDVPQESWHTKYVSFATENHLIPGKSREFLMPGNPMTKAEITTLIARAMRFSGDIRIRAYMTAADPIL